LPVVFGEVIEHGPGHRPPPEPVTVVPPEVLMFENQKLLFANTSVFHVSAAESVLRIRQFGFFEVL
jgi:hypothetical protein